jgi:hypothetical protein
MEALTTVKLSEDDQEIILAEITHALCNTHKEELLCLRSYRLEGEVLMYICTDQWLG